MIEETPDWATDLTEVEPKPRRTAENPQAERATTQATKKSAATDSIYDGFGYVPWNFRFEAFSRRDGIDGACQLVEWMLYGQNKTWWGSSQETTYQKKLAEHKEYWARFTTANADYSAERIARELKEIWTFPIRCGRQWSAATIAATVQELDLDLGAPL
jgi:hypothetical protein